MATPSEILAAASAIIAAEKDSEKHAPGARAELTSIHKSMEELRVKLQEVEKYIVLGASNAAVDARSASMAVWDSLQGGRLHSGSDLRGFVERSPVLDFLYRQGFDITQAFKFSSRQIEFSKSLGDNFLTFSAGLRAFRRSKAGKYDGERSILLKNLAESAKFLRFLEMNDVIKIQRLLIRMPDRWQNFELDWFGKAGPERDVLVAYAINSDLKAKLLMGEWLNAYVYTIIFDHLRRNRASFELYTDLSFRCPADVVKMNGEFDVIGQTANRLICVECKSGLLGSHDAIPIAIEKISKLRGAISAVSASGKPQVELFSYLVFDPEQNNEADIRRQLAASDIRPLRPDQIRGEIVNSILAP